MSTDLDTTIQDNAEGPAFAQNDEGAMRQHSLPDQIEADKHLAANRVASAGGLGIRLLQLKPPGAV